MDASSEHTLSTDECWAFLEGHEFGRLAYAVAGEPDLMPINYLARERQIYFRTASGSKLAGLTINSAIAFESDEVDRRSATSVIVHGTASEITSGEELDWADGLGIQPWIDTPKWHVVRITPSEVTGRRFDLKR